MVTKFGVVTGERTGTKPARKLGKHGAELWRNVMVEYEVADAAGLEMLCSACAALDRAEACRATIDRDGEIIRSKAGPRETLLKHELAARSFVVRTLTRLGLNFEPIKPPGRPAGGLGWVPDGDE
jgi:hypothetical protein